jgi:hypothetical protein
MNSISSGDATDLIGNGIWDTIAGRISVSTQNLAGSICSGDATNLVGNGTLDNIANGITVAVQNLANSISYRDPTNYSLGQVSRFVAKGLFSTLGRQVKACLSKFFRLVPPAFMGLNCGALTPGIYLIFSNIGFALKF